MGTGLSVDAFSICVACGIYDARMRVRRAFVVATMFAASQFVMPLLGWMCVRTVSEHFSVFERLIPWIALVLLVTLGGNMLYESFCHKEDSYAVRNYGLGFIFLQSVATSIDTLTVGFATSAYSFYEAFTSALTIGLSTFAVCLPGVFIGKALGNTRLSKSAGFIGGIILLIVGFEIFISSFTRG